MNIEQANGIAMPEILEKLNYKQVDESDYSNEKIIELVCSYLQDNNENHTPKDALRWINNMTGNTNVIANIHLPENYEHNSLQQKTRKAPKSITKSGLKHYIENRGIPLKLAMCYLQEIKVKSKLTNIISYCIGLKNEKGGFDLRAENFKGSAKPNDIAFIRGTIPKPDNVHVFRNFIDYLTLLTILKKNSLMGDAIILNSMKLLGSATPYIKHYGYKKLYSYMSNDKVGSEAIASLYNFTKHEQGLSHTPMNKIYMAFKDLNQWHIRNLRQA